MKEKIHSLPPGLCGDHILSRIVEYNTNIKNSTILVTNQLTNLGCHIDSNFTGETTLKSSPCMVSNLKPFSLKVVSYSGNKMPITWSKSETSFLFVCQVNAPLMFISTNSGNSSLVRRFTCSKGHLSETNRHRVEVRVRARVRLGFELGLGLGLWLGLWLELGLGLVLVSNFGICTTTFRTSVK